jgi:molybdopterin-synthase adenylyltransferase
MDFIRQMDIANPAAFQNEAVLLIGAGGIGAATAVCLAKVGFPRISVMDFDTVEAHNIPNQFLPCTPGIKKVDGLRELVEQLVDTSESTHQFLDEKVTADTDLSAFTIIIAAVDSMGMRQEIWQNVMEGGDSAHLFVDARMGADSFQVFSVDLTVEDAIERYESEYLFPPEESIDVPCTMRATMYLSMVIAGFVTKAISDALTRKRVAPASFVNLAAGIWQRQPLETRPF